MTTLEIRPPSHDETSRVVSLLTAGETEMRRRLISASVSGALSNTQAKTIGLVAVREGEVVGAAIATALPGGTGVLAGMRVAESADEETAKQLFDAVAQYLIALGVHFLQVACSIEGAPPELAHAGFGHLADLEYLSVDTAQLKHEASPEFILRPASHLSESQLSDLVTQTYIDTKDCPQMSSFRSAAETLASYRASPTHDPSMWRVAFAEDAPVGCVLGLPFADSSIMELTYMGVVPAARGKGLGRELVNETRRMAIEQKLVSISLAVDLKNEPACRIYRDLGFVSVYAEAVWGIRLSAEPQIET